MESKLRTDFSPSQFTRDVKASRPFNNSSDWSRRINEMLVNWTCLPPLDGRLWFSSVRRTSSRSLQIRNEYRISLYPSLFPVPVSHSPSSFTSPFGERTVERNEQSPFSHESIPNTSRIAQFPFVLLNEPSMTETTEGNPAFHPKGSWRYR